MYFAPGILPAFDKTHNSGTGLVRARLTLHNPVQIYEPWPELTYEILQERGFDCVVANFRNTAWEFAIYRNQDIELVLVDDNFQIAGYRAYINSIAPAPAIPVRRNIPIQAITFPWRWPDV
jgi:hypothetical protein